MSTVFQQIAQVHRARISKKEQQRVKTQQKHDRYKAYFRDSGIPEMWEDVKDIVICNPAKQTIEGLTVALKDLVVPTDHDMIMGWGLALQTDRGDAVWWIEACRGDKQEKLYYRHSQPTGKSGVHVSVDAPNAKQKFVLSFARWLARHITPQMLIDMNIDLSAPAEEKKRTRKFLQVAE